MSKKDLILPNKSNVESETPENAAEIVPLGVSGAVVEASGARPAAEAVVGAHSNAPITPPSSASPRPGGEGPGERAKPGPKTPAAKKAVSRNAVKHGLRSPHPFIIEDLESPEEWEEFKLGIIESWQPVGIQELELATNVAYGHWKLRRCRLVENMQLSKQVDETEEKLQQEDADEDDLPEGAPLPEIDPERLLAHQYLKVIPDAWSMDRMLRYEAFVRKALSQDRHELEIQQARRGGIQALPARVVFSSDPSAAKVHMSANDIPEFQIARQNLRFAELALAERKRDRRASGAAQ